MLAPPSICVTVGIASFSLKTKMLWLLVALLSYFLFAVVFLADKALLTAVIRRPLAYTFYTGILGTWLFPALPYLFWRRVPGTVWFAAVLAGAVHLFAFYFFYSALKRGEASRVVPLASTAVPLFNLPLAWLMLQERLSWRHLLAFALLVAGGMILSLRWRSLRALAPAAVVSALLAGLSFALFFALTKYAYARHPFLPTLITFRVTEAALAYAFLAPLVLRRGEGRRGEKRGNILRPGFFRRTWQRLRRHPRAVLLFIANKLTAAGAGILQQWAVSLGRVSLVTALQGSQHAFLLMLAVWAARRYPRLIPENIKQGALKYKAAGIALISLGVVLLVLD
jgi:uncharacterized membrane protein